MDRGRPVKRPIAVGKSNDKFVQVVEGLREGDQIVLNPMAIYDSGKTRGGKNDQAGQPSEAELAQGDSGNASGGVSAP